MCVPIQPSLADGYKPHAVFDQPSRQQTALSDRRSPVSVAHRFWLGFDVEGFLRDRRPHEVVSFLVKRIDRFELVVGVDGFELLFNMTQQQLAVVYTVLLDVFW